MNRILIVRLGALGDIVHALPAAAALRAAYPAAEIDWIVNAPHAPLLDLVPILDRRIVIGRQETLPRIVRSLRGQRYDLALDLQGLIKSAILARLSGAARVVGFSRTRVREPMAARFYSEAVEPDSPPGAHVVFKNLGLLAALGIRTNRPEFPLERRESPALRTVLERLRARGERRFALLNAGAAWPNKRWPAERFGRLADVLRTRHALPSFVLWGPGEQALAQEVVDRSNGAAEVAPPTALSDLVTLTASATLFVSGDTGPLHIAAAVGTPVVGLYGPTSPQRNGPWWGDDVTVSRFERCECHHLRRCRAREWCLADVSLDEVGGAVSKRLELAGFDA